MKLTKKIAIAATSMVLAGTMAVAATACGGGGEKYDKIEGTVKIGVLVADASGEEALAFKNYYTTYVKNNYDVEFVYSAALDSPAAAKTQAQTFIGQNCHAIIDMADQDRVGIAELCNDNKVYYAIASGMLSHDVAEGETESAWDICKTMHYFLGEIGPDNNTEFEAGKAMGEYYKNTKQVSKVGIYGAFIPNPMHAYRLAGILTGLGDTYNGKSGMAMIGDIFGDATGSGITTSKIAGSVSVSGYMAGYGETTSTELDSIVATNPDAFLSVGMATTFFSATLQNANIEYSDIDAFTANNGAQMKAGEPYNVFGQPVGNSNGKLTYLAGKYASSIGPVIALVLSAANGNPIRDNGNAVSIAQSYKVATNGTEFDSYATADSGSNPIYNKTVLDTIISTDSKTVSYADFKAVVDAH